MRFPAVAMAAAAAAVCAISPASGQPAPEQVPYVPTPTPVVAAMLSLASVGREDVLYDLGSGDGRIVITAAKRFGTRGVGFEIQSELIRRSRMAAHTAGLDSLVRFVDDDLFTADLGPASVVTLYLSPEVNRQLRPKLLRELAPGARVVSHGFHMGEWMPDSIVHVGSGAGRATLFLWIVPADVDGFWEMTIDGAGEASPFALEVRQRHQELVGTVRRDGVDVARLSGRLRGTDLVLTVTALRPGLPDGGLLTGRLGKGVIEGSYRPPAGGPPRLWRASRFRP